MSFESNHEIVPARAMGPIAASDAGRMFKEDLSVLGSDHGAGGTSRTEAVASLATALAEAALAGAYEQGRALAEELRALAARPAAPSLRRAR